MHDQEFSDALGPVLDALSRLDIPWCIGGSIASSIHGIARSSLDADVVIHSDTAHVDALVTALVDSYYVDHDAARTAVARRASFNAIHLATMIKIDLFVRNDRPFDQSAFDRRETTNVPEISTREIFVMRPEDIVLYKLEWFRVGQETSERQWNDVLGVMNVQGDRLDIPYLLHWAAALDLLPLLQRAFRVSDVAGLRGHGN
jgi:hypothetical protein